MYVYIVFGAFDYESIDILSVHTTRKAANAAVEKATAYRADPRYDAVYIEKHKVEDK
jgi:hypothetical protein